MASISEQEEFEFRRRAEAERAKTPPKEKGEVASAWDNFKNNVRTALAPVADAPRPRNGPLAPLPANASWVQRNIQRPIDQGMHALAGGDQGYGEVHPDTAGGKKP